MLHKLVIISSLSLSLVFSGCGKKVVNPAKTNDLDKQGAMNGDAEGKQGTGKKDIEDLKDALEKEREERIKGDQDLQTQITLLIATLAQISIKIANNIGKLDKESKETQTQLADYIKANDKNLADLAAKMTQSNADLAKQMRIEINIDLQKLRDDQAQASQAMKDEIAILIADLEAKLTKQDADLAADLRAEIKMKTKKIEASLDAFKAEVAVTYATKAELNVLAASVEGIKKALAVLNKKFDADLKSLADAIHAEHNSDILLLQSQITLIQADMRTIAADLYKMEQTLNLKINNLKKDIREEISSIKVEISQIQKQDSIQIAAITALSIKLTARTEYLFQFFSAVTKELSTKVQILQSEVSNVSNDQKDYIKLQISQLEQKIKELADEERAARAEIEEQIRGISDQIVALEIFARENRALIIANRTNIEKTNEDLAKAKVEFRKELDILNNEFSKRLDAVKQTAINITTTLGIQVQQQFVNINAQIAVLNQRITANIRLIIFVITEVIGTDEVRNKPVEAFLSGRIPLLVNDIKQLGFDRVLMENEIVNIISPFAPAVGVDPASLNKEFKELLVAKSCEGFLGEGDVPASLNNREWFMHIAGEYAGLLASGVRSGNPELDRIFFGHKSKLTSVENVSHSMVAAVLSSYSTGTTCQRAVTAWAKSTFLGTGARAKAIRDGIASSAKIKALAIKFGETVNIFKVLGDEFEDDFIKVLVTAGANKDLVKTWLFTTSDNLRPIDRIISYTLDMVEDHRQLAESDANRNRIFALAKTIASQQQLIGNATRSIDALEADFDLLKTQVAKLALCVTDIKKELAVLRESQITALNLIAEIAGRLGFEDIVDRADDEIVNLGGTPITRVPEGCYGVQHFYNHATNNKLPVARCESLMTSHDAKLSNLELTKCAIHGGFQQGNDIVAYTWGNQTLVTNGWNAQNSNISGHKVTDGLTIKQYDPTHAKAKELAARKSGTAYPADRESTLVYRVLGNAAKFKIAVTSESNAALWPYYVTVNAADYLVGQTNGLNVYEIPLPKAISKLGACTWNRNVKISALSNTGATGKFSCDHRFHTFSPIVLNLESDGLVQTTAPTDSRVFFDLDANGVQEKTGWIQGNSGLLARDIDGNGKIDDGRELFGEATIVGDSTAENGYKALAYFDENKDGVINLDDNIYSDLIVWKDINADGRSQQFEMKSLTDLGITSIKAAYKSVDVADQLQADAASNEGNLIKYKSTYTKVSGCNAGTCSTFDVYFGSSEYTTVAK